MTHQAKGGKPQTHAGRTLKDPLPLPTESPFVGEPVKLVRRYAPPTFEYRLLFIGDADNLLQTLNARGTDGWRAVTYIPGAGVLIERPLPDAGA